MKICFVGDAGSIHFIRWVSFFASKGHNVSVICFENTPAIKGARMYYLSLNKFNRLSIPLKKLLNRLVILRISFLVRFVIKPDILHAHYLTDYGFYAAATGFHPFVVTVWGNDILLDPEVSRILRWEANYTLKRADLVTTDAEYLKKKIISIANIKEGRVHVIQWGMDFENYGNISYNDKLRQELGLDKLSPIILSARGFQSRCNIDIVIKSISYVIKEFPEARFILLGEWGRGEYEELAKKEKVSNYVLFPGAIEYGKLFSFYGTAVIMLSVSSIDGTPASLLEGMACGCFPIVSDIPPNCEWVKDGVNGSVVKLMDSEGLGNSIIKALRLSDGESKRIKDYNHRLISEKGDHKKNMLRMEELYFGLMSSK